MIRRLLFWATALVVGVVLSWFALVGGAFWVEWAHPWTDKSSIFSSFHVVDESGQEAQVSWRRAQEEGWITVGTVVGSAPKRVDPQASWLSVGPLLDSQGRFKESGDIVVEIRRPQISFSEYRLTVTPASHHRLRITEDAVFLSEGEEGTAGFVSFGPESRLDL